MQYEISSETVDATFDALFNDEQGSFSGEEVTGSFAKQGVTVEEAAEKHFASSCAGDDDWSMV